jgi:hypothetical protein
LVLAYTATSISVLALTRKLVLKQQQLLLLGLKLAVGLEGRLMPVLGLVAMQLFLEIQARAPVQEDTQAVRLKPVLQLVAMQSFPEALRQAVALEEALVGAVKPMLVLVSVLVPVPVLVYPEALKLVGPLEVLLVRVAMLTPVLVQEPVQVAMS